MEWKELIDASEASRTLVRSVLVEYANGVTDELAFYRDLEDRFQNNNSNSSETKENLLVDTDIILTKYEHQRSRSSGVVPCLAFAPLFLHLVSNDTSYQNDERFRELLRRASLVSGVDNDLQSYQKQDDSDWNYITIQTNIGGIPLEDAFERGCQRHHQLVNEIQQICGELKESYPTESQRIEDWMTIVFPSMWKGFVSWQCHVKRYKTADDCSNSSPTPILLERLFPGEAYHTVDDDGTFAAMDVSLHQSLEQDIRTWARECHLLGSILSETKFQAVDPALCTLLLLDCYHHRRADGPYEVLSLFGKFFTLLLVLDDMMENPELHKSVKAALLTCVDSL